MSQSQAKYFQGLPGVVEVFPNYLYKQQTTRSWDYLGLSASSTTNLLHDTNQGDGAIIGVLDSGVWPESESFNDKGLGPIPSKWKGYCQSGDSFTPLKHCNKKLIGARYFVDGFAAELNQNYQTPYNASENDEYASARDKDGHGTHCASTAGGSFVSNVSINGLARGTARGGAPKARIAMYKVLWGGIGSAADILKAFDEAIHDGVDVLSLSLGFDSPLYPETDKRDLIYYGTFHAAEHGIVPVCSAGNSGPLYGTVEDVAPWVITVAAATIDRSFPNPIILGNNHVFAGQGMYIGDDTGFVDLVFFEDRKPPLPPTSCEDITANDTWVAGKVVFCFTDVGEGSIGKAAVSVAQAGGLGIIATINTISSSQGLRFQFPILLVPFQIGYQILNYIRFTK
ncbi:Subtilase family protein [Perilla frutescens var. frutescens]|nr:Subtilase family protein [Perilla frutescens var. frutescens]